jgi:competence protein ComEA
VARRRVRHDIAARVDPAGEGSTLDPTSAPWRTIESGGPDGAAAGDDDARPPARRHLTQIAIIALAGMVAVASFLVAASSGTGGSVAVDGASPPAPAAVGAGDPVAAPGSVGAGTVVVVEVVGAVQRPGVFRLPVGARVGDLVDAAGGFGPRVDTGRAGSLNLAAVLKDGDQVRVPSRDDAAPTGAGAASPDHPVGSGAGPGTSAPVDLNRATSAELEALPGIGPVTAAKIIASREADGPFATVDDLRTRKLVGEKAFAQLKPLVTAG